MLHIFYILNASHSLCNFIIEKIFNFQKNPDILKVIFKKKKSIAIHNILPVNIVYGSIYNVRLVNIYVKNKNI